ncbi:MAG TPA: LLM class flavin-dependent oxidoreductase, partial [Candidatus Limnocylindria bacterium]|nr:LLM class flavin-dependent oxidoreductase [Candidatus Limnocylindria bacterium]
MTGVPLTKIPVSILDRANSRSGGTEAHALRATAIRARRAEELGYHRFWVAEHHGVPGIAGSAPTVLMGVIAAETERIRIGSGGVMLPNHQP